MNENTIMVAGVKISKEHFPKLYKWAQINPEGLEETLRSLAKASGGNSDDCHSVAVNLENDLAHG